MNKNVQLAQNNVEKETSQHRIDIMMKRLQQTLNHASGNTFQRVTRNARNRLKAIMARYPNFEKLPTPMQRNIIQQYNHCM